MKNKKQTLDENIMMYLIKLYINRRQAVPRASKCMSSEDIKKP